MQSATRPTSRAVASPNPRQSNPVNTQTKVIDAVQGRILCLADIRGHLSALNDLARETNAKAIIHTGDFGFFESHSIQRISDRTLRHLAMYSPLIPTAQKDRLLSPENTPSTIRSTVDISLISEFPLLLSGQIKLQVPVFTVWGACEDVVILEKFRAGSYSIDNLHVLDEATTRCLDVGGIKLRLLGLGGALVQHKMFDNGEGNATIAGGQGTMWATALQIGELVDTAQRVLDPTETRVLISHASPGREGIIAQLALILKADLTISAGLHFRYASSYNEFSVQPDFEGFRRKLVVGKEGFDKVWDTVKTQVDAVIDENQRVLLDKALSVMERIPSLQPQPGAASGTVEEPAWKNCWNWNLCDAAFGSLVLDIKEGRISAELKSQGFNYAYRRTATGNVAQIPNSAVSSLSNTTPTTNPPTKGSTPAPVENPVSPLPKEVKSPLVGGSPLISGKETPKDTQIKTNGTTTPSDPASERADRGYKRKERRDRKDRDRPERETKEQDKESAEEKTDSAPATASDSQPALAQSGKATPVPDDGAATDGPEGGLRSPVTDSTGTRTPTSRRPHRHPWTLFLRFPGPLTDSDLQGFFGGEEAGVSRVTVPQPFQGRDQRIAYVEFVDQDKMKVGLEKNNEKIRDMTIEVKIAHERGEGGERGGRGRPRGRGRGGYTSRALGAAGLSKRNGDVPRGGSGDNNKTGGDSTSTT
ncbi:hypothetical protein EDD17DRAFT_1523517 [Pisolithus thermaeus]|nr:hypothetical protein EDD17DRAFT_1523517 [Pisolithus thermaeus]